MPLFGPPQKDDVYLSSELVLNVRFLWKMTSLLSAVASSAQLVFQADSQSL